MYYLTFAENKPISMKKKGLIKILLGTFCVNTRNASIMKLFNRDMNIK